MTKQNNRLIDATELGERLGLSPRTVFAKRDAGEPFFATHAIKLGRAVRWDSKKVDEYIDSLSPETV